MILFFDFKPEIIVILFFLVLKYSDNNSINDLFPFGFNTPQLAAVV